MNDQPAGRQYWQSLNEYAQGPEFREKLASEFPGYDPDELLGMSRRQFMKLAGASMALAGLTLTGCRRWPEEEVVPHNHRPEGSMPGMPEQYATMQPRGGVAYGVFATTVDGRPIHLAGSPIHPINGDPELFKERKLAIGAADSFTIASIFDLYDPDRTRHRGSPGRGRRPGSRDVGRVLPGVQGRRQTPRGAQRGEPWPDVPGAKRRAAGPLPAGDVDHVGAAQPRQRGAGGGQGVRAAAAAAVRPQAGAGAGDVRQRAVDRPPRVVAARPRLGDESAELRRGPHEPHLRGRPDAYRHQLERG